MKATWRTIITVGMVFLLSFAIYKVFFAPKADGINIKVHSETKSTVFFYPVCPKCDHVSVMHKVNISKGEEQKKHSYVRKMFFGL